MASQQCYLCRHCSAESWAPADHAFRCPACGGDVLPGDAILDALEAGSEPIEPIEPAACNIDELIEDLREAGLDAWDKIDDPETFLRDLRGGSERDVPRANVGRPAKRMLGLALQGIALVVLLVLGSTLVFDAAAVFSGSVVTREEYSRIKPGMSYGAVRAIIGVDGEELSRNRMEGVPGVMPGVDTVMYAWQNEDGSNMNAMFQDGELVQKAQFGLR